MKKFGSILLTFAVLFILCAGALPAYGAEYTLTITTASPIIGVGNGTSVNATVSPSYQTVSWSSSDPSNATVSGSGSVTGVSAGTVTIIGSITDPNTQSVITASTTITGVIPMAF